MPTASRPSPGRVPESDLPLLLTGSQIAQSLNVERTTVYRLLERLHISPVARTRHSDLYRPEVVEALRGHIAGHSETVVVASAGVPV